jgi:hypothetical protein
LEVNASNEAVETRSAVLCCIATWQEVDLAIAADIGTLQRLPGIVGDGKSIPSLQYCIIKSEPGFARYILCTSCRTPLPFHDQTVLILVLAYLCLQGFHTQLHPQY